MSNITGAGIFIVEKYNDKKMVVLFGKYGRYDDPGGSIDPGETPEEAACRETQEETANLVKINKDELSRISYPVLYQQYQSYIIYVEGLPSKDFYHNVTNIFHPINGCKPDHWRESDKMTRVDLDLLINSANNNIDIMRDIDGRIIKVRGRVLGIVKKAKDIFSKLSNPSMLYPNVNSKSDMACLIGTTTYTLKHNGIQQGGNNGNPSEKVVFIQKIIMSSLPKNIEDIPEKMAQLFNVNKSWRDTIINYLDEVWEKKDAKNRPLWEYIAVEKNTYSSEFWKFFSMMDKYLSLWSQSVKYDHIDSVPRDNPFGKSGKGRFTKTMLGTPFLNTIWHHAVVNIPDVFWEEFVKKNNLYEYLQHWKGTNGVGNNVWHLAIREGKSDKFWEELFKKYYIRDYLDAFDVLDEHGDNRKTFWDYAIIKIISPLFWFQLVNKYKFEEYIKNWDHSRWSLAVDNIPFNFFWDKIAKNDIILQKWTDMTPSFWRYAYQNDEKFPQFWYTFYGEGKDVKKNPDGNYIFVKNSSQQGGSKKRYYKYLLKLKNQ
jgi:8-oxo-dGTP pyrophosphatase MutT (NUDIX family)